MVQPRNTFKSGVLVGLLLMIAAQAVHWLITSESHPAATPARTYSAIGQGVLALAVAGWLTAHAKKGEEA